MLASFAIGWFHTLVVMFETQLYLEKRTLELKLIHRKLIRIMFGMAVSPLVGRDDAYVSQAIPDVRREIP